jgi:hypothetical protein
MYQGRNDDFETYSQRIGNIDAYSKMISCHVKEGMVPHHINFMFNQLPPSLVAQTAIMRSEVTRVHELLRERIVRKWWSPGWDHLRPFFIGCRDLPVLKNDKNRSRLHLPNAGAHFNVVALVPPVNPLPVGINQHPIILRQSRLHVGLQEHFDQHRNIYLNENLCRIHVTEVTYGDMTDYTLKNYKRGNVSSGEILLLR